MAVSPSVTPLILDLGQAWAPETDLEQDPPLSFDDPFKQVPR